MKTVTQWNVNIIAVPLSACALRACTCRDWSRGAVGRPGRCWDSSRNALRLDPPLSVDMDRSYVASVVVMSCLYWYLSTGRPHSTEDKQYEWDEHGYVLYCPCMGECALIVGGFWYSLVPGPSCSGEHSLPYYKLVLHFQPTCLGKKVVKYTKVVELQNAA